MPGVKRKSSRRRSYRKQPYLRRNGRSGHGSYKRNKGMGGGRTNGVRKFVKRFLKRKRNKSFKLKVKKALVDNIKYRYVHRNTAVNFQVSGIGLQESMSGLPALCTAADVESIRSLVVAGGSLSAQATINIKEMYQRIEIINCANSNLHITAHLVAWRKETSTLAGNQTVLYYDPDRAFRNGFQDQQTDAKADYYQTPSVTPFENQTFCQVYKVIKTKSFIIPIQGNKKLLIKRRNVALTPNVLRGFVSGATSGSYGIKGLTKQWLLIYHGHASLTSADIPTFGGAGIAVLCQERYKVEPLSDNIPDSTYSASAGTYSTTAPNIWSKWDLNSVPITNI